jgi:subtilisin family serine protease
MSVGNRNRLSAPGRRSGRRLVVSGLAVAVVSGLTLAGPALADSTPGPSAVSSASAAGRAASAAAAVNGTPSDGLLVRFDDNASAGAVEKAVAAAGGAVEDVAGATGFVRVSTGAKSAASVAAALAASPVVETVEPNRIRHADLVPNDPRYTNQAAYLQEMHLPDAWTTTTGNDSMILAIVDSGVQLNHPDLAGRLVPGYDFVNNDSDPSDDFGHGTMVAGIAAAVTNNGQGVAGATWRGKIMPVKVLDSQGAASDEDIAAGITFAVDHGASVINLSLGGPGASDTLQTAVDYATSRNVVVVAAAGNDGENGVTAATTPHYPAACNGVISVGATDAAGNHAAWSSYGSWVDVVAPGVGIVSTTRPTSNNSSLYGSGDGTSFSSPLVAAVAFLMRAADPNSDEATIRQRLIATADDLGAPGVDSVYGAGMVDAAAAVDASENSFSIASTNGSGYWMLGQQGAVYRFGGAGYMGNASAYLTGGATATDLAPTPSGAGYWIVDSAGHVYGFGDAAGRYFGGAAGQLRAGEQVTSISATPSGGGYWLFTNLGRVFNFGTAPRLGDLSALTLNGPILDSVPTPSGQGYYMVGSDGGIFAFGDAHFDGSMGGRALNAPVQSLVPDPDGSGYWLVASDGGVFAFDAPFRGSMGGVHLNAPVTGMVPFGNGYLMVASDGGAFDFSDQPFSGSLVGAGSVQPIVSVATKAATS